MKTKPAFGGAWCASLRALRSAVLMFFGLVAVPCPAQVVINEIMYHPSDDAYDSEYVELYNTGSTSVDLSLYRFDDGIDFAFLPGTTLGAGDYIVVCANPTDFGQVYPGVTGQVGPYSGKLSNGGESLRLSRRDGSLWRTEDELTYNDRGIWPRTADGDGPSMELIHPGFPNQYGGAWSAAAGLGTPGAPNSVYQSDPAPLITAVNHDPPLPFGNAPVTITALAAGHNTNPLTVTLRHRRDSNPPGSYTSVQMLDDGLHGDGAAGDEVFGATVPGLPAGALLDFQISATDANGPQQTAPAAAPGHTFLCYFGTDPDYTGEYRTYHILMTAANRALLESRDVSSDVLLDGTLVLSDGRIFYNCGIRYRGSSSRHLTPKSFRVELPLGQRLEGSDDINLNAVNPILQHLGMDLFRRLGVPTPRTEICRTWLNETFLTQTAEPWMTGPAGGVYCRVEKLDGDFVDAYYQGDSADGNLYRGTGGKLDWLGSSQSTYENLYTKESNQTDSDWQDIVDLLDVFNNTPLPANP